MTRTQGLCLGILLLGCAAFSLRGGQGTRISQLRTADVAVQPLMHDKSDPTAAYPEAFPLQVALYWSKADENPMAMIHVLREMGIPFFVTRNLDQALRHPLVIIYPSVEGPTFNGADAAELSEHVRSGGSIFGVNVLAGAMKQLFGFRDTVASRRRYRVDFAQTNDPVLRYLNRPEEKTVPLGSPKAGDIFWTNSYTPSEKATVIARYDDGSAALVKNELGKGSTYACGVSYFDVVLRNQVDRDYDAERHYVNTFEPGADVWMLLLRAWYEANSPDAVRVASIPNGQSSVLLLSHDVDWENSFAQMLDYARMESAHHARSTFFIQTKYVSDANSVSFFFGPDLEYLEKVSAMGATIGSHSVIHSRGFNAFNLGDGTEAFPGYQPRGTGFDSATGATVFGEVRVSKALLDGNLPGHHTVFFRAGHLRVPNSLPEALQRTGYLFDSSFTANDLLTNFPFALPLGLGFEEESGLYEFPVTIEDEEKPPLLERVDKIMDVIQANAENQGMTVVLIHSNAMQDKLAAEQKMLEKLPPQVTATDMESYARFWRALQQMRWKIEPAGGANEVRLTIETHEPLDGATFEFHRRVESIDGRARVLPDHQRVVLPALPSHEKASFLVRYQN